MREHDEFEELSAYLDGEANDPAAVERRLASSPEAARCLEVLRRMSAQLKAIPAPEVSPAFATRVVGHVREEALQAGRWRVWAPVGALCVLALVLGIWVGAPVGPVSMNSEITALPVLPAEAEEQALLGAFEGRDAVPEMPGALAFSTSPEPDPALDATTEEWVAGMADTPWFDALAEEWEADEDLDLLVQSLDAQELETFKQLLREYERKGATI